MTTRWLGARTRSVALLASLCLNLVLISAIAAYSLRDPRPSGRDRTLAGIERLADRLPAEEADKLRAAYAPRASEFAAAWADVRRLQEAVSAALRAQPFDPKALSEAAAQLAQKRAEIQREFFGVVSVAAAGMSPSGRAELAEFRRRPSER
jgi:hypothetical protein